MKKLLLSLLFLPSLSLAAVHIMQGDNVTLGAVVVTSITCTGTPCGSGGAGSGLTYSSFTATQPILYNNVTGAFSATPISLSTGVTGTLPVANGGAGTLQTQVNAVGVATGTLRTDLNAVGVATGTLRTTLDTVATDTTTIYSSTIHLTETLQTGATFFVSSGTVSGQLRTGTLQGAALATCGDSTHALSWGSGSFGCQEITIPPTAGDDLGNGTGSFGVATTTGGFTGGGGVGVTYGITAGSVTVGGVNVNTALNNVGTSTASLQTQVTATGVSTGVINGLVSGHTTSIINLGASTGTIQTQVNSVAVSTGTLQTQITATGVSTGTLRTDLNAVSVATGAITTIVTANSASIVSLGASTGTIQAQANTIAVATGTLRTDLNAVSVATGAITTIVSGHTTSIINLGASTGTINTTVAAHTTSIIAIGASTGTLSANFPVSLSTNVMNILPVASGGTGTATPNIVAGTNITSITGTWPNQTINAATQGGSGASSLAVTTGTNVGFATVASSPTTVINAHSSQFNVSLQGSATAFLELNLSSVTAFGNTIGGDASGTLAALVVTDDSHAHTGVTLSGIDISGDTNLAVTVPVILTGDTLSLTQIDLSTGVVGTLPVANGGAGTLQDQVNAVGVATGTLRTDLNAVSVATGAITTIVSGHTTSIVNLGASTGTIQTQANAIAVATGTLRTDLNAVSVATGAITAIVSYHTTALAAVVVSTVAIGVSTASLQTQVNAVAVATGTLRTDLNAVSVATGTLRTNLNSVSVATGTLQLNFPVSLSTNTMGTLQAAQMPDLAGDLDGTAGSLTVAVVDDSHAHTGSTISGVDISADTNLAATLPVILTGDTVSLSNTFTSSHTFTSNVTMSTNAFIAGATFYQNAANGTLAVARIQWPNGTIQLSSPTAGGSTTPGGTKGNIQVNDGASGFGGSSANIYTSSVVISNAYETYTSTLNVTSSMTLTAVSTMTFGVGTGIDLFGGLAMSGSAGTPGQFLTSRGGGSVPVWEGQIIVKSSSTFTVTGTALGLIPNLNTPLVANTTYFFSYYILFQTTAALNGVGLAMDFPGSPSTLAYRVSIPFAADGAGGMFDGWGSADNDTVTSSGVQAANTTYVAEITGVVVTVGAGDMNPQIAGEFATKDASSRSGSIGLIRKIY